MEQIRPNKQIKYRKKQLDRGLVRFEIQVEAKAKERFDEMVDAAAEEIVKPWDKRQRMAIARRRIFNEITEGLAHQFFTLKDQIDELKEEIKALSPKFFHIKDDQSPLPNAISALPDSPSQLKKLLAKQYVELQKTKSELVESKRRAKQYLDLYESISDENDRLRSQVD